MSYVHWQRLISSSLRGDGADALHHAQQTEAHSTDWWQVASAQFLAEAADCLDRVGHTALAWEYLERAREDPQDADRVIAMSECALLARHGDPVVGSARSSPPCTAAGSLRREHWRVGLFAAYAALSNT